VRVATALLVMDVQQGIVERYRDAGPVLDRVVAALAAARAAGMPVVFVRVGFRTGYPEVSPRNRSFSTVTASGGGRFTDESPGTQLHPALARRTSEPVVVKKRVSAFTGSDLEVLLRSAGVDHLVLAGIATSGVVLSTVREAADRDYRLTVLADACADNDPEVHRVLVEKVFPRQAEVTVVADWAGAVASG
jgi:nicotinamidase-related amidase